MTLRYFAAIAVFLLLSVNLAGAATYNLKPRQEEADKKYLPVVSGYTQIKIQGGGGSTIEAVEFGDVFLSAKGELEGGLGYKTELNLSGLASGGAIALGEVYIDIPELLGSGNIFRFGRFRIPFGNDLSLTRAEKPALFDASYRACFWSEFDLGIQNYSKIKDGSYELAFINGEGSAGDSSKAKDFVGRYIIKNGDAFAIGFSQYLGSYNGKNRNNFGGFVKSSQGSFTLLSEYANGTDRSGANRTLNIYNVLVQKMSPKLESVLMYESWDPNIDAPGDHLLAYSFTMNFFKSPKLRLSSLVRFQKSETASDYSKTAAGMVQLTY